jgi:hypothetical protein
MCRQRRDLAKLIGVFLQLLVANAPRKVCQDGLHHDFEARMNEKRKCVFVSRFGGVMVIVLAI